MATIESQLTPGEKAILTTRLESFPSPMILEIGTYMGGGSTLTFLEALKAKGGGRLFGVEASASVFAQMKENIRSVDPDYFRFFEPIHGYSQQVIPDLLLKIGHFDVAFLDGGNNPREQIEEFHLLEQSIPVGGLLFSHDANLRKGAWLVPYLQELDNWHTTVHQASEEGLLEARKSAPEPSPESRARAERLLQVKQRSPIEFATQFFPSSFKGLILRLLPYGLRRRIGEGRR
jgi:predicted O-methyltransferase YrrM